MGIRPKDFWQMYLWEIYTAFNTYCQFNGIEPKQGITQAEAKEEARKYAQG